MNWMRLFDLRGTNLWLIAASVGCNVIWTALTLFLGISVLGSGESAVAIVQLALMVSEFLGPLLCGWFIGWMAADGRGLTYGLIGSLGSVALILFTLFSTGITGLMVAVVALAGGLNGGLLSERRRLRK